MLNEQVKKAIEVLKNGGLILYPTDTLWGIGCDATNPDAVEKIYRLKGNERGQGMIVLVGNADRVSMCVKQVPEVAWELFEAADKPLTLILDGGTGVASNLLPDDGTIGIRIPDHRFCRELMRAFRKPLVSTSANIHGKEAPGRLGDVDPRIVSGVDFVVPASEEGSPTRKPSTIIKINRSSEFKIIRP